VANTRVNGQAPDPAWLEGMTAAAKHRHVYCKVSGLVEGTGRTDGTAPADVEYYRPVLDAIWNTFGEDRLVYGSNWPVSERFASCATVQTIVRDYFAARGKGALNKVFWKNSLAVYKWVNRESSATPPSPRSVK
jgi:predicted TIM-barrel fold metal-dependent hydrolase